MENLFKIDLWLKFAEFEEKRKLKPSVETKEMNQGSDDDNLRIFLPTVTVSLLTIVVCIIIFLLWRRHRDDMETLVEPPAFSMRDKLRAESLKSFDTLLSRHFDPNRLRQYRLDHVHYVKDLGVGSFGKVFQGKLTFCARCIYTLLRLFLTWIYQAAANRSSQNVSSNTWVQITLFSKVHLPPASDWQTFSSSCAATTRVDFYAGKPIESVVYC